MSESKLRTQCAIKNTEDSFSPTNRNLKDSKKSREQAHSFCDNGFVSRR